MVTQNVFLFDDEQTGYPVVCFSSHELQDCPSQYSCDPPNFQGNLLKYNDQSGVKRCTVAGNYQWGDFIELINSTNDSLLIGLILHYNGGLNGMYTIIDVCCVSTSKNDDNIDFIDS